MRHCVVNANLLLTSAQARLKRLQFAYQEIQNPELSRKVHEAFDAHTRGLADFRSASDDAEAAGPRRAVAPSPKELSRNAPPADEPTTTLLNEVALLRAGYAAEASRRSAEDVRKALEGFGPLKTTPAQRRALDEGRRLKERLERLGPSLALAGRDKPARPARIIAAERDGLRADAKALGIELELLVARFKLDNWLKAHPEGGPL